MVVDFISQFDEEFIKANRTADYRTLCRRTMDITSIFQLWVGYYECCTLSFNIP